MSSAKSDLFVRREGHGPPVVLVHGGVLSAELTWREQLPLAERWSLVLVDRSGYGRSAGEGEDIEADGRLVAELLEEGAHLVGQSSGAVAALLAAARRPQAVLSLTLCEPPAFQLAPGSADARASAAAADAHFSAPGEDAAWLRGFVRIMGGDPTTIPDPLPQPLAAGAKAIRNIRRYPWRFDLPLDDIAGAPFAKLVVSGDHSPAFEAGCDALADRLGADRIRIAGARHLVPHTGATFNERVETFMLAAGR